MSRCKNPSASRVANNRCTVGLGSPSLVLTTVGVTGTPVFATSSRSRRSRMLVGIFCLAHTGSAVVGCLAARVWQQHQRQLRCKCNQEPCRDQCDQIWHRVTQQPEVRAPTRKITEKWIGSTPTDAAIGARIGARMIVTGSDSRIIPVMNTIAIEVNRTA